MDKMTERPCPVCMRGSGFDRCSHSTCPMRRQVTAKVSDGQSINMVTSQGTEYNATMWNGGTRKFPTCKD